MPPSPRNNTQEVSGSASMSRQTSAISRWPSRLSEFSLPGLLMMTSNRRRRTIELQHFVGVVIHSHSRLPLFSGKFWQHSALRLSRRLRVRGWRRRWQSAPRLRAPASRRSENPSRGTLRVLLASARRCRSTRSAAFPSAVRIRWWRAKSRLRAKVSTTMTASIESSATARSRIWRMSLAG